MMPGTKRKSETKQQREPKRQHVMWEKTLPSEAWHNIFSFLHRGEALCTAVACKSLYKNAIEIQKLAMKERNRFFSHHLRPIAAHDIAIKAKGHPSCVTSIINLTGGEIASCTYDDGLPLPIRISTKKDGVWCSQTLPCYESSFDLLALQDGGFLSSSESQSIRAWNKQPDGQWTSTTLLEGHTDRLRCPKLALLPDGRIASGCIDEAFQIWTKQTNGEWRSIAVQCRGYISALLVLPDGRIVTGNDRGSIQVWSEQGNGGWVPASLENCCHCEIEALKQLPQGGFVSTTEDLTIQVWEERNGTWQSTILLHYEDGRRRPMTSFPHPPYNPAVMHDGRIVSLHFDEGFRVWSKQANGDWNFTSIKDGGAVRMAEPFLVLANGQIVCISQFAYNTERKPYASTIQVWEDRGDGNFGCAYSVNFGGCHDATCLCITSNGEVIAGSYNGEVFEALAFQQQLVDPDLLEMESDTNPMRMRR